MHNAPKPNIKDLPARTSLFRSTIIASVSAVAIALTVVLPAEYAIDPTGIGRLLGLTEMGEIKQQLEVEAEADRLLHGNDQSASLMYAIFGLFISSADAQETWQDEITFTLAPGEATEIKAVMSEGAILEYSWSAKGGRINFDLHAHKGKDAVTYKKGRGATADEGSIEAPFAGNHGWFWRNRDDEAVTVTLQLRGEYSDLLRSE